MSYPLVSPFSANNPADYESSYLDNSNYEQTGSVAMAQAFVQACRAILLRRPTRSARNTGQGSLSMEWDVTQIRQELNRALQWLSFAPAAQPDGGVTFPSFEEERDYDSGYSGGQPLAEPYGDQQ